MIQRGLRTPLVAVYIRASKKGLKPHMKAVAALQQARDPVLRVKCTQVDLAVLADDVNEACGATQYARLPLADLVLR